MILNLLLGLYYVIVIYCRGTSVVRSLKLFALPYLIKISFLTIILPITCRYVISSYIIKQLSIPKKRRATILVLLILKEAVF